MSPSGQVLFSGERQAHRTAAGEGRGRAGPAEGGLSSSGPLLGAWFQPREGAPQTAPLGAHRRRMKVYGRRVRSCHSIPPRVHLHSCWSLIGPCPLLFGIDRLVRKRRQSAQRQSVEGGSGRRRLNAPAQLRASPLPRRRATPLQDSLACSGLVTITQQDLRSFGKQA